MEPATRTPLDASLGNHVRTHGEVTGLKAGVTRPVSPKTYGIVLGAVGGFVVGLFVALFADLIVLLAVGPVVGAAIGYALTRGISTDAVVREAALFERGVVLTDARGAHTIPYDRIGRLEVRQVQHVLSGTPVGDVRGRTEHQCRVWTTGGMGFYLDDRLSDVSALVETLARASGAPVQPLR